MHIKPQSCGHSSRPRSNPEFNSTFVSADLVLGAGGHSGIIIILRMRIDHTLPDEGVYMQFGWTIHCMVSKTTGRVMIFRRVSVSTKCNTSEAKNEFHRNLPRIFQGVHLTNFVAIVDDFNVQKSRCLGRR